MQNDVNMPQRLDHIQFDGVASIDRCRDLPNICAVYVAFSPQHVLYVGQSAYLLARWMTHEKRRALKFFVGVHLGYCEIFQDGLLEVEREWIQELNPALQPMPRNVSPEQLPAWVDGTLPPIKETPIDDIDTAWGRLVDFADLFGIGESLRLRRRTAHTRLHLNTTGGHG